MAKLQIYTTPTCPWCRKTKEWLKAKKIPYQEIDVAADQKAAEEMIKKSGQGGVPVLDIGGKIVVGFDPEGVQKALKSLPKASPPQTTRKRGKTATKKAKTAIKKVKTSTKKVKIAIKRVKTAMNRVKTTQRAKNRSSKKRG